MSMTREEAKEILENWSLCHYTPSREAAEAVILALDPLEIIFALRPVSRERVERMAGEWVQDINKGPAVFYCSSCGESFEIHSYEFQKYRFCPFCMSPMTDEAVEIRLKELEALHENIYNG